MKLCLVQHGDAVSKDVDPDRPLSEKGRRDIARLAAFLQRAGVRTERIVHSGKTRAEQSALSLAEALLGDGEIEATDGIAPNDAVEKFAKKLGRSSGDTMLVGHLPFMARLVAHLLGGSADAVRVAYQPGSAVCLERLDSGDWQLLWMLRPELLPD